MKIKDIEISCKASDMKLWQWEQIGSILKEENKDTFETYVDIFKAIGFEQSLLDDLSLDEFGNAIKDFNDESSVINEKFVKEIEIEGYTYKAFENLTVKDIKTITKYMRNSMYAGEIMAICFKRVDLTDTEHYAEAHIKHKAKLFREHLTADICLPYVMAVNDKMVQSLNFVNAQSKDTE